MSIISSFWQFLSVARLPRVAAGFTDNGIVVLEVKRRRNQFAVERMASAVLPKALLRPDFSTPNIAEPSSLANLLRQVSDRAGLKRESRWSISLPEGVAKSYIVNFDSKPDSREELDQMLNWKIERLLSVDPSRLRLVRQSIPTDNTLPRFLVTAVEESVIAQYEAVFQLLGWQAGLIMPRHMCEASWLGMINDDSERLMISFSYWGFVAVALRDGQPFMIRPINISLDERENELYRFAIYYRDKQLQTDLPLQVLAIGDEHEMELTQRTFADAFNDVPFTMISPAQLGVTVTDASGGFGQLAGPAGLAALAYK